MSQTTRRAFLKRSLATTAAAAAAPVLVRAQAAPAVRRPNILFCIADDWGFPHASIYGDPTVRTPTFDRVAREGALFTHAFTVAPTCSPSRAGILTGRPPHALEEGGNLWSFIPAKFTVFTDLLADAGYAVGLTGKGYGPGSDQGRPHNAAGRRFPSFERFLPTVKADQPFCYWFGSQDPHRAYDPKLRATFDNLRRETVKVPGFLPDDPAVRDDLLDYYAEVQRFDARVGEILQALEASGRAQDTLVVITSDNGMPFPHAKANLYDAGTREPLAVRWPEKIAPGTVCDALTSHLDLAPTFLDAAGVKRPAEMVGTPLPELIANPGRRTEVFTERERHAWCRPEGLGYPMRAVRTRTHLYIRNFFPDRWPAGDPSFTGGVMGAYGDIDAGPTKSLLIERKDDAAIAPLFAAACGKRPAEELYELASDPHQLRNLAGQEAHAAVQRDLRAKLVAWMASTGDPRARDPGTTYYDTVPYVGREARQPATRPQPARPQDGR